MDINNLHMEVTIGSKIVVLLNGQTRKFQIVGSADVDAKNGKVSFLSPIGEAVLGRETGERFEINLPNGKKISCRIIEIK